MPCEKAGQRPIPRWPRLRGYPKTTRCPFRILGLLPLYSRQPIWGKPGTGPCSAVTGLCLILFTASMFVSGLSVARSSGTG